MQAPATSLPAHASPLADGDALMGRVMQLNAALETLAALGAHLRIGLEGLAPPAPVHERLATVAELAANGVDTLPAAARQAALGAIRGFMAQAAELLAQPARAPGWVWTDPLVLQSQGRGSMVVASVLAEAAAQRPGLQAALAAPGAALLDIGTGCAWLAIALATRWPQLRVCGIDPWGPALELAERNVAAAGLGERITLRGIAAHEVAEQAAFHAVWLPAQFLGRDQLLAALPAVKRALVPGGWLLAGTYRGDGTPLAETLAELRCLRGGGHPWRAGELAAVLTDGGYAQAGEITATWRAPLRLVAARAE